MSAVVVLSGGLDSTSVLSQAVAENGYGATRAVSFDYGQRHRKELESARAVAAHYGIAHKVIDLAGLMHGSALLHDGEVPEGHYAEESMSATVVNGRNLLFASAAIADTKPGDSLWFGVHAGDHPIYPDCRPEFWDLLRTLAFDAYDISLVTPLLHLSKADGVKIGHSHSAPLHLTWSCYKGGEKHCGRCGTCVERAEAFALAEVEDPTEYADANFWRTATA